MPDGGTGVCECIAGSGTAQIESFLDDPQDCHITTDKLLANTLLSAIFKGDITLNGQKALSLGFGFTAVSVPAFTHDPPPQ
jgi:hypothetical protein